MLAEQIQQVLRPLDASPSIDHTVQFLNANFASIDSLNDEEAFNEALGRNSAASEAFQTKLSSSQAGVNNLIKESKIQALQHLNSAQELSLLRHSISDELGSLAEELSSSHGNGGPLTLLEDVEKLHRSLKELQSVKDYASTLHRALWLSEASVTSIKTLDQFKSFNEQLLSNYKHLQSLSKAVESVCRTADDDTGQGIFISSFLKMLLDDTWVYMREAMAGSLLSALEKLQWPMPVDYVTASEIDRNRFQQAFLNLLLFQDVGDRIHDKGDFAAHRHSNGLYAIQVLTRPAAQRFKYHFEGIRETNRLDKPEWYFAHVLNVSHEHRAFLENVIQQCMSNSSYSHINAWREFSRQLLPLLTRKLRRSVPSILSNPPLLAHTVYQCLAFDDSLRDAGFSLQGTFESVNKPVSDEWEGISEVILGDKEWFESWLAGERKFTEGQYEGIMASPDAWNLTDDDVGEDALNEREFRPTSSARRIKALVEQVTDRYKVLPQFLHKTRFLISVQVPILEQYHTRISESLDAFEALSSLFVRAVPGALSSVHSGSNADSKRATGGVEGSQRLIKAFVSAKWISTVLTNWGEEVFFLELWQRIREKAALRNRVKDVELLPNPTMVSEGAIFDELIKQYDTLAERAENMIIRQVCGEVEGDLKAHLFKPLSIAVEPGDVILSQTLLTPIARLSSHLVILHKSLPLNTTISLYRKIASHISTHILQRQVLYQGRGRMSAQDGKTVLDEANLWVETSRMVLSGGHRRLERPWEKLVEAGRLLSLEGESFLRAVRAASTGRDDEFRAFTGQLGSSSTREEVLDVLKVREDYSLIS